MGYPPSIVPVGHTAPVPRRIRGYLGGEVVFDTTAARYVWEWPHYPQYYVPRADIRADVLVDEEREEAGARRFGLAVGQVTREAALRIHGDGDLAGLARFEWGALDAWFEEDEEVFVHPRDPYARVDALRAGRRVRVELDGAVLAESASPVFVFETGLPTRHYLPRTDVDLSLLVPSETVTACPYKGRTATYWNVAGHQDLAWSYDFPTAALLPIAGLVAFYDEVVDTYVDGVLQPRPSTHFSR